MKDIILELGDGELKKLMDCIGCPFVILDKSGEILFKNKSFDKCGYSVRSIIPEQIDFKNLSEKTEKRVKVECDGRVDQITTKISPFKAAGSPENIFLVEVCSPKIPLSDIIESWYKTIDALSEMVYVVDEDYNLVKLNYAAAELSGNHPKDLIGKKCYKAVFGKEEACINCILPEIIASDRKEKLQTIRREWGRSFLVSAVKIKKGEYLFIMEDITKIEQLERNIAEIKRFTSIGGIISHIRHSVGNIVNAIKCSLQVFEHMYEDIDDKKRKEYIKSSLDEIKRMEYLLSTLREFSRYEGIGSFEFNFTDMVLDSKEKFSKYCRDKGADFEFEGEKRDFTIKGDKLAITTALTKIIDNSLEAMENLPKKKLMFKYSIKEHEATIEITDTGTGITDENLPKIAEPFFTTKKDRGGLGLYQAVKIIKTQGGDVSFSTKLGKGTTVKITFRK